MVKLTKMNDDEIDSASKGYKKNINTIIIIKAKTLNNTNTTRFFKLHKRDIPNILL
jgi:hypothetical protein